VVGWADAVHTLYGRARASTSPDPAARRRAARAFEAELLALCAPSLPPPPAPDGGAESAAAAPAGAAPAAPRAAPQTVLCRRIEKHLSELFVFVADPAVPATNNAAERSLRHLVTCRKISGGTRSEEGSATKMRLASLFGTWRAQGLDPLAECRRLLATPQA